MPAPSHFRFTIGFVTLAHGVVIAILLVAGANSCITRKKQPEILPVEFIVAVDDGPEQLIPAKPVESPPDVKPPPPKPEPIPEPEPEAPAIVKVPDKKPEPVKKPPETVKKPPEPVKKPPETVKKPPTPVKKPDAPAKKPIELGKRITAPNKNPPPPGKRLSEEELARRLALGATPGNRNLMPEGDALDFEVIRRRLYKAWTQPGSVSRHLSAEVEIVMNGSGAIISRRMLRPSGNTIMDESVMEAVQSVFRIDGLTPGFINRKGGRVTITFELSAGTA